MRTRVKNNHIQIAEKDAEIALYITELDIFQIEDFNLIFK